MFTLTCASSRPGTTREKFFGFVSRLDPPRGSGLLKLSVSLRHDHPQIAGERVSRGDRAGAPPALGHAAAQSDLYGGHAREKTGDCGRYRAALATAVKNNKVPERHSNLVHLLEEEAQ